MPITKTATKDGLVTSAVRLAAPEHEVLRAIGEESKRKGTSSLSSRQIDRIIKAARLGKSLRS